MNHQHKCGFGVGGLLSLLYGEPMRGCGYVWEHPDKKKDEVDSDAPHYCPNCGAGPWVLKYSPRTCEMRNIPWREPAYVGADDPEFQHACMMEARR